MLTDKQREIWEDLADGKPHQVLRKYRTELGLTQKDVGVRMGLNCNGGCSTVSDFESGKKDYVSFDFVMRYVKSLYPKEQTVDEMHKRNNSYMKDKIMRLNGKNKR